MDHPYTYQTLEITKVPCHKSTEPALRELFSARYERDNRERKFDPKILNETDQEDYLESIETELKKRGRAMKLYNPRQSG